MGLNDGGLRAGGLRNLSEISVSAIPDSGMFQSPIYQFWAGDYGGADGDSPFAYPEVLGGLSDATAVGGPIFQADKSDADGDTWDAGEYDGADDGHDFTPDSLLPVADEPHSVAALLWPRTVSGDQNIISWGSASTNEENVFAIRGSAVFHDFYANSVSGGSPTTGDWITVGYSYNGGANREIYLNGSSVGSNDPGTVSVADANHSFAYRKSGGGRWYFDGFIAEIVVSDAGESDQAFSDYHTDRLG